MNSCDNADIWPKALAPHHPGGVTCSHQPTWCVCVMALTPLCAWMVQTMEPIGDGLWEVEIAFIAGGGDFMDERVKHFMRWLQDGLSSTPPSTKKKMTRTIDPGFYEERRERGSRCAT